MTRISNQTRVDHCKEHLDFANKIWFKTAGSVIPTKTLQNINCQNFFPFCNFYLSVSVPQFQTVFSFSVLISKHDLSGSAFSNIYGNSLNSSFRSRYGGNLLEIVRLSCIPVFISQWFASWHPDKSEMIKIELQN